MSMSGEILVGRGRSQVYKCGNSCIGVGDLRPMSDEILVDRGRSQVYKCSNSCIGCGRSQVYEWKFL